MVIAPALSPAAGLHDVIPALPETLQVIFPRVLLGAVDAPPVTAAVKVKVEPYVPAPLSLKRTVGVSLMMMIFVAAVAGRAK